MLNEFLVSKIKEEGIGNIWFQQAEATLYVLHPVFKYRIINRRADVDDTLKSRRTQNESLFGADFCPEA